MLRISVAVAFVLSAVLILYADLSRSATAHHGASSWRWSRSRFCTRSAIFPMDSPEEKIHFIQYGVVALLAYEAFSSLALGQLSRRGVCSWLGRLDR